ncbi:MAG: hypothetical protein ABIV25_04780 [Paracoccaceae bacterium]
MSTFIKDFVEKEKINRRNFLLASATGLGSIAMPMAFGGGAAFAATDPALAWSYRDRASAYWNTIVSGVGIILVADTLEEAIGLSHSIIVIKDGAIQKRFDWTAGVKPSLFDLIHHMI